MCSAEPDETSQPDFFEANIVDPTFKSDMVSLEHPLFALRAGDRCIRKYTHNGITVTVKPGQDGCATIHDKDIWIYCISHMVEALNRGREISRKVRFTAYDFLVYTKRGAAGSRYRQLEAALSRLKQTTIETNIETAGMRERAGFGLIDAWKVVEAVNGRMVAIEVTLPEWLFRAIRSKSILTLSRAYFAIRKPLHRRIYELARKHCGRQPRWQVSLAVLLNKTGSTDTLSKFRAVIKALVQSGELTEYLIQYCRKSDNVTFYQLGIRGAEAQMRDILKNGGDISFMWNSCE